MLWFNCHPCNYVSVSCCENEILGDHGLKDKKPACLYWSFSFDNEKQVKKSQELSRN